jgi:hypothetical protein
MAQKEGINTPLVVTLAAISAAFLIVTIFSVEAWFNYEVQTERDSMFATIGDSTAADTKVRQERDIRKQEGNVISIENAMHQLVQAGGKVPWQTKQPY